MSEQVLLLVVTYRQCSMHGQDDQHVHKQLVETESVTRGSSLQLLHCIPVTARRIVQLASKMSTHSELQQLAAVQRGCLTHVSEITKEPVINDVEF